MEIPIDDLMFPDWKASTAYKRRGQFQKISEWTGGNSKTINPEIVKDVSTMDIIKDNLPNASHTTLRSYYQALLSIAHELGYTKEFMMEIKRKMDKLGEKPGKETKVDDEYKDKLIDAIGKNRAIDVIISVVINTGPLRLSDMLNTKLKQENPRYNFLDFDKMEWRIRAESTKNNKDRVVAISEGLKDDIMSIYEEDLPEWLLTSEKTKKQFQSTEPLTKLFKKIVGVNYGVIRKSYINEQTDKLGFGEGLANDMGHSIKSEMRYYSKLPEEQDDEMKKMRDEMNEQMKKIRDEMDEQMKEDIKKIRDEMDEQMKKMRDEMQLENAQMQEDIKKLSEQMQEDIKKLSEQMKEDIKKLSEQMKEDHLPKKQDHGMSKEDRLHKAVHMGLTESRGGMNVPELYSVALSKGYKGKNSRSSIVSFLSKQ